MITLVLMLIGHSMAGSEMTFLAQKHASDLSALIYLDANADPMDYPWSNAEYRALTMKAMKGEPGPPKENSCRQLFSRSLPGSPEANGQHSVCSRRIRSMYLINSNGSVGSNRTPPYVGKEIDAGSIAKDYRGIQLPALALLLFRFRHRKNRNARRRRGRRSVMFGESCRNPDGVHSPLGDKPEGSGSCCEGVRASRCPPLHVSRRGK